LNVKPPLHERKAPHKNVKPPIDDFLATVLCSTLVFFMYWPCERQGSIFLVL